MGQSNSRGGTAVPFAPLCAKLSYQRHPVPNHLCCAKLSYQRRSASQHLSASTRGRSGGCIECCCTDPLSSGNGPDRLTSAPAVFVTPSRALLFADRTYDVREYVINLEVDGTWWEQQKCLRSVHIISIAIMRLLCNLPECLKNVTLNKCSFTSALNRAKPALSLLEKALLAVPSLRQKALLSAPRTAPKPMYPVPPL